jgi:hypothetical protein
VAAADGGVTALADALPKTGGRGVVLLNFHRFVYAGSQAVEVSRPSERSLVLEVERGYLANDDGTGHRPKPWPLSSGG